MRKDEEKIIRQLSLLTFLLSEKRPRTPGEIQESVEGYWGMNDETFARRFFADRADLAKLGIEVGILADGESADTQLYYLSEEEYRLPSIAFTAQEQRALALALAALDGRFAYARPLRLALTALCQGMPAEIRADLEQLPVALAADEDAIQAGKQLARLEDAVSRGKSVAFAYRSASGAAEQRRVEPYNLFLIQGHWYVVGFDQVRRAMRTFRLTRISGAVRFLTEKARDFTISTDYDPESYRARPPWLIGPVQGTAVIRVDETLSWWVSRLRPHVTPMEENGDGSCLFEAPYADEALLLSWVAGLGEHGEIMAPEALRATLGEAFTTVARAHQEGSDQVEPVSPPRRRGRSENKATAHRVELVAPERLAGAIWLMQYLVDKDRAELVEWSALQSDLGLSREEVEADLSLINLVNFGGGTSVLYAEAGPGGVSVTRDPMAEVFAHPAHLSPLMVRSLLLAFDLLGEAIMGGNAELSSVREKITGLAAAIPAENAIVVDDIAAPSTEYFDALSQAINERTMVEIEYFTAATGHLSRRVVEPYLLFRTPEGWYLEAYCLSTNSQRTFRLEFVRSLSSTDKSYSPRAEVDLTHRKSTAPLSLPDSANWASVRLTPRWKSYLDDKGISCLAMPTGDLRASLPYFDERWLVAEVLRFLGDAVLEYPQPARQKLLEVAASLAERYSTPNASSEGAE